MFNPDTFRRHNEGCIVLKTLSSRKALLQLKRFDIFLEKLEHQQSQELKTQELVNDNGQLFCS